MIKICGQSDDIIDIEGQISSELSEGQSVFIGAENDACLKIVGNFTDSGWEFTVSQPFSTNDTANLPWPVRIEQGHGYSLAIVVDCPNDTPVGIGYRPKSAVVAQALAKLTDQERAALGV